MPMLRPMPMPMPWPMLWARPWAVPKLKHILALFVVSSKARASYHSDVIALSIVTTVITDLIIESLN